MLLLSSTRFYEAFMVVLSNFNFEGSTNVPIGTILDFLNQIQTVMLFNELQLIK
jgi:hypothetical protein